MEIDSRQCPNCGHDVLNWVFTCPGCDQVPGQTEAAHRLYHARERRQALKWWGRAAAVVGVVSLLVGAEHVRAMREERALPPLRAQIVERLDLEAYRGKFVILDFWVSWCGPCRYQVPALQALYEETGSGEEVALIGVSLDTSLAEMQKFLRRHQVGWTQVCDRQGWASPLARRYEVHGVPTLVLLDRDGAVIRSDVRLTEIQSELERRRDSPVQPAPERRPSGSTTKTL